MITRLLLATVLPLMAAEQNIETMNRQATEQAWQAVTNDFDLPPADGVIQAIAEPLGRGRVVRFISTRPISGQLVFRIVAPNGSELKLNGISVSSASIVADLWNGSFPPYWPAGGPTRFDAFLMEDGRLSRVSAYVDPFWTGITPGPQLGEVMSARIDGRNQYLTVQAPFRAPAQLRVVLGFSPVKPDAQYSRSIVIGPPFTNGVQPGENNLTVCEDGLCTTRTVYFHPPAAPTPFPTPPPFPAPPPVPMPQK